MRKLTAVFTALAIAAACAPQPSLAMDAVNAADITFRIDGVEVSDGRLSPGSLSAAVMILNTDGAGEYLISLGAYGADGELTEFSAKLAATEPKYGYNIANAVFTADVPAELEDGASVRVVVMDAKTLRPTDAPNSALYYRAPQTDVETGYTGIYERFYTLDGADGSLAVVQEGSRKYLRAASVGTPFRLKDMGEGYVAFVDSTDAQRRLQAADGAPERGIYGYGGDASMLWRLEPAEDGRYYVRGYDGAYLALEGGAAVMREAPYPFSLTKTGESPFTLMTSLDGFGLFTEAEQQRIIDICTSVGAGVFPRGTAAGAGTTFLDRLESSFTKIYDNAASTDAEAQKAAILEALQTPIYPGLADFINLNPLKGGGAEITVAAPVDEELYIWDLGYGVHKRIDVTYKTDEATQVLPFYTNDPSYENVRNAIDALAKFPYSYRKYLKKVCVYASPDENSAYYCDGPVLTVRLRGIVDAEMMARSFAHELGHSIDMAGGGNYQDKATHWCQTDEWQRAFAADMVVVSDYGNMFYTDPNDVENYGKRNYYEELAEFARLYFQCCGSRDREIGLKQLFPNQYDSFGRLLERSGMEHFF